MRQKKSISGKEGFGTGKHRVRCERNGRMKDCVGPLQNEWQHLEQQVKGLFRDQEEYVQLWKDYGDVSVLFMG